MTRRKTEIVMKNVFDERQDGLQLFVSLMLNKAHNSANYQSLRLEVPAEKVYNSDKVFSDVRVAEKEEIA